MNSRTEIMFGIAGMERLRKAHVLVVGLGGVGGAALEMLVRAGVGNFSIVDADVVKASNINRQLVALHSTIGQAKTEAWYNRLLDINPTVQITIYNEFLEEENTIELLTTTQFDFVIDAIDTIFPKVFLIQQCIERNIPIISSMGSGGKTDTTKVQLADISKTEYCALARIVRKRLVKRGIHKGLPCVFSTEVIDKAVVFDTEDEKYKRTTTGTVSYLPNLFGCWIAGYVINKLQL